MLEAELWRRRSDARGSEQRGPERPSERTAGRDCRRADTERGPVDLAAYVPRHIEVEPAVSGVPTELLLRLLSDATATGPDQPALGPDLAALLDDQDARVGVESLSFSSGPLRVTGSGLLRKHNDGKAGIDIHLVATGLNALIAEAQGNPRVQPILPMVFMAKGIARPLGEGLVWDIVLGDGVATVNGIPLGQPPPTRQAPSSR